MFAAFEVADDHLDGTFDTAEILLDDLGGLEAYGFAFFLGREQVMKTAMQFGRGFDLDCAALVEEGLGDSGEVLHVGAKDNWLAESGGFDGTLATLGRETFPDEDHSCGLVEEL